MLMKNVLFIRARRFQQLTSCNILRNNTERIDLSEQRWSCNAFKYKQPALDHFSQE